MDEHPDSINDLSMFEQYRYYYEYYSKKYKKVAVLMQVGDFYEIYGVDNEKNKICNIKELLNILPFKLQTSSKPYYNTERNPLKAGCPKVAKSTYISFLVERNDYIVVQIDEIAVRENSKNSKTRAVTSIHSPGTYIQEDGIEDAEHRYLVQIVIEGYKDPTYKPMAIGLAAIDIETGDMDFYEVYNDPEDENYALDEVWRYLSIHCPREVLLMYKNIDLELESKIKREITAQVNVIDVDIEYDKLNVQTKFLEKVFKQKNVLDWLEISKFMTARLALIFLLKYVINHNKILTNNLKKPDLWFSNKYLLLANNAILQLDLVSTNRDKTSSVFNLINFTTTHMGKRLLKQRLLNPLKDVIEIKARYKAVEQFSNWESYEIFLNGIVDLEKYHRKIELGILSPSQLGLLYISYVKVQRLIEITPQIYNEDFPLKVKKYVKFIKKAIDFERANNFNSIDSIDQPIFKEDYEPSLNEISNYIKKCEKEINNIVQFVNSHIPASKKGFDNWIKKTPQFNVNSKLLVSLENDKLGYHIKITKNRLNMLTQIINKYKIDLQYEEIGTTLSKSHVFITTKKLKKIGNKMNLAIEELKSTIGHTYRKFLQDLENNYADIYKEISKFVGLVDVYKSSAKCAKKYNYVKPKVKKNEKGYIVARNMRHPLAERLCEAIYVPHDVNLGKDINGILMYGINSSGKSSYMKAVGVNLILAQAGFYVPAEKFEYSPYNNVLTRILGNDDMQSGLSSFAVEMIELRGILARMGNKSLILGDELCKGTETVSGPAIVAQAIIDLLKKGTNFVFATHLHNLVNMPQIKKLDNLGIYHIKVRREGKKLIYDRTIQPGSGDSLYGLEVAKAMGLPEKFIEGANEIRKKLLGIEDQILGKVSRYSKLVYLLKCGVCGEDSVQLLETHHINEQEIADENDYIDHFHKNHPKNLVGLCKKCHKDHHKGKITIKGWIETSNGFELNFTSNL